MIDQPKHMQNHSRESRVKKLQSFSRTVSGGLESLDCKRGAYTKGQIGLTDLLARPYEGAA
ncbi:hypothetical protein M407DRAFT_241080 [Tulasnella calospora MUT 4182]|uniref:Uncharacterized protein n=1 Tax=Tulasnella calospora MUT 4182 TaxID=1051891 RepID=A0A0C3QUU4_9AGAM|nr:hypothetical protein M407DRAFT_241080 [Tulasnella calospora MUT 4182]